MIDTAINHIASELNRQLKSTFELDEDIVLVSNILEQDGSVATHINNKIVISLVNIEKDSIPFRQQGLASIGAARSVITAPPLYFNLYLMFSSVFAGSHYQEGLKFISNTITYFQGQHVIDHHNSPNLDKHIEKLILEVENLSMNDLSNLWGILSGKYLPSVLYKVKMVTIDSNSVLAQLPSLKNNESTFGH